MRNPDRIDPLLERIKAIWHANPDLRLGQLILNTVSLDSRLYYMEDDVLLERLYEVYKCPEFRPDHNGECLNCDEPASEHDL